MDASPAFEPRADWFGHAITVGPAAPSVISLSGQVNLLTTESFDHGGQLLNPTGGRNVAFVSVGTQAAGGAWVMQGAMTQGDLASGLWRARTVDCILAPCVRSRSFLQHQRYDGRQCAALVAIRDSARNVGAVSWLRPMDGVAAPDRGLWQRVRSL